LPSELPVPWILQPPQIVQLFIERVSNIKNIQMLTAQNLLLLAYYRFRVTTNVIIQMLNTLSKFILIVHFRIIIIRLKSTSFRYSYSLQCIFYSFLHFWEVTGAKISVRVVIEFTPHHHPLPPHQTRPPPQLWHPGTAGTQTPSRSCCSRPR